MTIDEMKAFYAAEEQAEVDRVFTTGQSARWQAEYRAAQSAERAERRNRAAAREAKVFTSTDADRVDLLVDGFILE